MRNGDGLAAYGPPEELLGAPDAIRRSCPPWLQAFLLVREHRATARRGNAHYTGGVLCIYCLGQPWLVLEGVSDHYVSSKPSIDEVVPKAQAPQLLFLQPLVLRDIQVHPQGLSRRAKCFFILIR